MGQTEPMERALCAWLPTRLGSNNPLSLCSNYHCPGRKSIPYVYTPPWLLSFVYLVIMVTFVVTCGHKRSQEVANDPVIAQDL